MASAPKTVQVQQRESFIDQKFKRRLKKLIGNVVATVVDPTTEPNNQVEEVEHVAAPTVVEPPQTK